MGEHRAMIISIMIDFEERLKESLLSIYHIRKDKREEIFEEVLLDDSITFGALIRIYEKVIKRKYSNNKDLMDIYLEIIKIIRYYNSIRNTFAHYNPVMEVEIAKSGIILQYKSTIEYYKDKTKEINLVEAYHFFIKYYNLIDSFIVALGSNTSIMSFFGYDKMSFTDMKKYLKKIHKEYSNIFEK